MKKFSDPYTRVQAPAGFNYTPSTFQRRMTDQARDAVAFHAPEKKRADWRYLAALVLLAMAALVGLTGCSKAEAVAVTAADAKRAAAGAWACPGMTAVWLDSKTVQCLKEVK